MKPNDEHSVLMFTEERDISFCQELAKNLDDPSVSLDRPESSESLSVHIKGALEEKMNDHLKRYFHLEF